MTSTIETPINITPCPVDWCPEAGHHLFDDEMTRSDERVAQALGIRQVHTRCCRYETGWAHDVEIGAETYHTDEGVQLPVVVELDIHNLELTTPAEVSKLIDAIQRAAAVAFPEDVPHSHTLREAERELRSAEAEVAQRSGTPGNQLTAAWIRLGKAHAAMALADRRR